MEIPQKKFDYKWVIIIILIVLALGAIISSNIISDSTSRNYAEKDQKLKDSILVLNHELIEYKLDQQELMNQLYVKNQEIVNQKTIINKLKKKLNEKADSVYNLNDNQSLEFLSKWLSKRDSIR